VGTNYYWVQQKDVCPHCLRGEVVENLHIGKSSMGWCFSLQVFSDPETKINGLGDWIERFSRGNSYIKDESGERVSVEEMMETITRRCGRMREGSVPFMYSSWEDFHFKNHSEFGPNGLLRHRLSPGHCVGHGDGPWDLIVGDFS
jgi:hypothetical protein